MKYTKKQPDIKHYSDYKRFEKDETKHYDIAIIEPLFPARKDLDIINRIDAGQVFIIGCDNSDEGHANKIVEKTKRDVRFMEFSDFITHFPLAIKEQEKQ